MRNYVPKQTPEPDPADLTGPELTYEFLNAVGGQLVGSPKGPFAIQHAGSNELVVFGAEPEDVRYVDFDHDISLFPLTKAKLHRASFSVEEGEVVCRIGNVLASGRSYSEAAMRCLIQVHRTGG